MSSQGYILILPEDIHASPTIASFRKKHKTYLYAKAYPPQLIFSYGFTVVVTYFWTLNLHVAIVLLRLRVHYSVEIKCYKSRIRIISV